MKRRTAKPVIDKDAKTTARGRHIGDSAKGESLEMIYVVIRPAMSRRHLDELDAVVKGEGQQFVMSPASCCRPVKLFKSRILAKREMLASGLDHVAQFKSAREG